MRTSTATHHEHRSRRTRIAWRWRAELAVRRRHVHVGEDGPYSGLRLLVFSAAALRFLADSANAVRAASCFSLALANSRAKPSATRCASAVRRSCMRTLSAWRSTSRWAAASASAAADATVWRSVIQERSIASGDVEVGRIADRASFKRPWLSVLPSRASLSSTSQGELWQCEPRHVVGLATVRGEPIK